jgi:hypothetical protein
VQIALANKHLTGGDFFADELPKADVLVRGHILHDWSLEPDSIDVFGVK